MIGYIKGRLLSKAPDSILVDIGGVGYEVYVSLNTFYELPSVGSEVELFVHTYVREDTFQLYGFISREEKMTFLDLITISGVGPRVAIQILSGITPSELKQTVVEHNVKRLQKIPGIGKKTAERILLELKHKFKSLRKDVSTEEYPDFTGDSVFGNAVSALVNLGYKPHEAKKAVSRAMERLDGSKLEDVLKEALRTMV